MTTLAATTLELLRDEDNSAIAYALKHLSQSAVLSLFEGEVGDLGTLTCFAILSPVWCGVLMGICVCLFFNVETRPHLTHQWIVPHPALFLHSHLLAFPYGRC